MVTYASMQFPEDEAHVCNILRASSQTLPTLGYNLSSLLLFPKALFSILLSTLGISLQESSLTSLFLFLHTFLCL